MFNQRIPGMGSYRGQSHWEGMGKELHTAVCIAPIARTCQSRRESVFLEKSLPSCPILSKRSVFTVNSGSIPFGLSYTQEANDVDLQQSVTSWIWPRPRLKWTQPLSRGTPVPMQSDTHAISCCANFTQLY